MISTAPRHWRTATLSSQVPAGKPVRVVCGEHDLAMFRDADGVCRALADRCAHRRAPLSQGRLTEQFLVECPYHGWQYHGASGACVAIPNLRPDEKVPKNYRVQSFETVECDGFIQVLLGAGDAAAEPNRVELPRLDRQWEGERVLAYPENLFMDTLVDCPSAILAITGIRILDDHPFGDPMVSADQVTIEYAAVKARRIGRSPKRVAADFAYLVRMSASKAMARIEVFANSTARLHAAALLVGIASGPRITRVLWRGSGCAEFGAQATIGCVEHIDPAPVSASSNWVSRSWAGMLGPVTVV